MTSREPSALEATLGRVSLRMARSLDLNDVLGEITRGLVRDLDAAMGRIWLVSPEEPDQLRLVASAGLSERLDGSYARVPIGSRKIGQIAATRTPVCKNDVAADPRFVDKRWLRESGLVAFAGYPLTFDDELLGVLAIFARRQLSDSEFAELGIFAAQASIAIKNARLFEAVSDLTRRLEAENTYLKEELRDGATTGIIGDSPAIRRVLRELEHVAATASTVLLCGETGTGKELFARAVHERSPRRSGPLVKVNCAAIAPTLVESELFGHEKGAFTGALQRRIGRFELAHGGTLFLDEVGELSLEAQAKLLRVLQEREFERVGGTHSVRVDVRIVAATNRDLGAEVKSGRFRSDLYFRLNVFPIQIPPLRDRREDVPLIADAFLRSLATRLSGEAKALDAEASAYLQAYDWPGNVRELQNVLERASILARGTRIGVADLPELNARDEVAREPHDDTSGLPLKDRVSTYERSIIADALRAADGNQSEAARVLQTSRATLQYKMKVYGL
jgi:Nif-specific regulatory protein